MALGRMKKELAMLSTDPGPGISCYMLDDDNMHNLEAQITGPTGSPFEAGTFRLSVQIPERYPLEPPRVRFVTPIYHPNIDSDGRICLDTLKVQPQGCWSPSININTLLLTIRLLIANPNADDGLVPDITEEYRRDVGLWKKKALEHTSLNAVPKVAVAVATGSNSGINQAELSIEKGDAAVSTDGDKEDRKSAGGDGKVISSEEDEENEEEENGEEEEEEEEASLFADISTKKQRFA